MKIKLVSDFTDMYDHWFCMEIQPRCITGETFEEFRRVSTSGLCRHECLEFLEKHGYDVPPYGEVTTLLTEPRKSSVYNKLRRVTKECTHLVVYTDERAHCGEGKLLLPKEEALEKYPENLAMEYIAHPKGISWRYLQLGYERWWLQYTSDDAWRSNCGNLVFSEVFCREEPCLHPTITMPLFAIDFIPGQKLWAVDFNIAPGIRGSGIEAFLSSKDVYNTLVKAYETLRPWIIQRLWTS